MVVGGPQTGRATLCDRSVCVCGNPSFRRSRARKFGLTGVVLMFSDVFLIDLIRLILVRNLPITERAAVEVACIGWHCLLFSSSAMFLVAAVFTGRDVTKPADAIAELPKSFVADNPNPYQPPGQ